MTGPNKGIAAGNQLAFWGQLDSSAVFAGTSGSVAQGATGEPMGRLLGIKTAQPGPVEPEFVNVTGDDTVLGSIDFGPNQVPSWIMEMGAYDLATEALLQGTLVETLIGARLGVLQPNDASYPDCCIIYNSKSKSKDAGSDGVKAWSGFIVPIGTIVPLGRQQLQERTPASYRYKVQAQIASKKPWNITIVDGELGTSGAPLIPFSSDYPLVMERFTGDGSTVLFNLTYTPVDTAHIVAVVGNGQKITPTSVSVANKTFTVAAAPGLAVKVVVLYGFTP